MIKDQELAMQIFEMMNTSIEASQELMEFLKEGRIDDFNQVAEDLYALLDSIRQISKSLDEEKSGLNLWAAIESICISLERIVIISVNDKERARHKIEFELIPLIEEMRVYFYYFGMVYPDEIKMKQYYEKDIVELGTNRYQAIAEASGQYKYEISIVVLGYNKLDYTKQCLRNLQRFFPKNVSHELILVNHGSSDGTKEFFESVHPDKQLDIAVNGGGLGAVHRIVEGRFILTVSNDVLVMKNAIENMYDGMSSDEEIGWVVPMTTNASNLQAPEQDFRSLEEVESFAVQNNVRNKYRWEQRTRLVNPIEMLRGSLINKWHFYYIFHDISTFSFPDDKFSLLCRRNGYKSVLAKDSFCFHYGSATLRNEVKNTDYSEGRQAFAKFFGVDPWSTGFCFSYELFHTLDLRDKTCVNILGIDCGMGSNSLKIKESLKENAKNTNVFLKNITTKKNVLDDLRGVSDEVEYVTEYSKISETKRYDYIICEEFEPVYISVVDFLNQLISLCKKSGRVIISLSDSVSWEVQCTIEKMKKKYPKVQIISDNPRKRNWIIV